MPALGRSPQDDLPPHTLGAVEGDQSDRDRVRGDEFPDYRSTARDRATPSGSTTSRQRAGDGRDGLSYSASAKVPDPSTRPGPYPPVSRPPARTARAPAARTRDGLSLVAWILGARRPAGLSLVVWSLAGLSLVAWILGARRPVGPSLAAWNRGALSLVAWSAAVRRPGPGHRRTGRRAGPLRSVGLRNRRRIRGAGVHRGTPGLRIRCPPIGTGGPSRRAHLITVTPPGTVRHPRVPRRRRTGTRAPGRPDRKMASPGRRGARSQVPGRRATAGRPGRRPAKRWWRGRRPTRTVPAGRRR